MGQLLEIIHYGEPVPAMRPRVTRYSAYNPEKYTNYKRALAAAIYKDYGFWAWDIPGTDKPKERTKFLRDNRYRLDWFVYRSRRGSDADNFMKTIMDALQQSGVIGNDSQIYAGTYEVGIDKANPRVEIRLTREVLK